MACRHPFMAPPPKTFYVHGCSQQAAACQQRSWPSSAGPTHQKGTMRSNIPRGSLLAITRVAAPAHCWVDQRRRAGPAVDAHLCTVQSHHGHDAWHAPPARRRPRRRQGTTPALHTYVIQRTDAGMLPMHNATKALRSALLDALPSAAAAAGRGLSACMTIAPGCVEHGRQAAVYLHGISTCLCIATRLRPGCAQRSAPFPSPPLHHAHSHSAAACSAVHADCSTAHTCSQHATLCHTHTGAPPAPPFQDKGQIAPTPGQLALHAGQTGTPPQGRDLCISRRGSTACPRLLSLHTNMDCIHGCSSCTTCHGWHPKTTNTL
jgi:hypothetical protein